MLTKKQLAEKLSMSITTIDRHMKNGMPYIKLGKLVRFNLEDVLAWFEKISK